MLPLNTVNARAPPSRGHPSPVKLKTRTPICYRHTKFRVARPASLQIPLPTLPSCLNIWVLLPLREESEHLIRGSCGACGDLSSF